MARISTAAALAAVAFLFGCAGDQVKEEGKAGVEERTPGTTAPPKTAPAPVQQPPVTVTPPVQPPRAEQNPLKDPANILSRRSVFYDYDSDVIKEEYRPVVQAHAKYLASNRGARMLVQGNTDERGSREYNLALGQRRADALKRMLVLLGAADSQIESVSLGEEKPRCNAQSEECYAQNRRSDMLHSGEF